MIPELSGIDHIHIFVRDRARAQQWYRDVLGFEPVQALMSWAGKTGPLTVQNREESVHFALFERADPPATNAVALATSGAGFLAWKAHLEGQRLELRIADHELAWSLYFSDPDGNMHEITTYDHDYVTKNVKSEGSRIGPG